MKDDEWHSGPPPSVGWWQASCERCEHCLRWWNGSVWSEAAFDDYHKNIADAKARSVLMPSLSRDIEWKHRPDNWPERSKT